MVEGAPTRLQLGLQCSPFYLVWTLTGQQHRCGDWSGVALAGGAFPPVVSGLLEWNVEWNVTRVIYVAGDGGVLPGPVTPVMAREPVLCIHRCPLRHLKRNKHMAANSK